MQCEDLFYCMSISLQEHGPSEKIDTGEHVNITAQEILTVTEVSFISLTTSIALYF